MIDNLSSLSQKYVDRHRPTVCFKGVADKQIASINLAASWFDGASIHHDGWPVEPGHRQNDSWHVFVTSWEGYVGVIPLATHHSLYAVSYDVARG